MNRKYKVTIIQATIKQYRGLLFLQLWERLEEYGIELTVVYSRPGLIDTVKNDNIDLPSTLTRTVKRLYLLKERILVQFLPIKEVMQSDLIIVSQATGCMHNYPLLLLSRLGLKKVAFWGHGYNRQGNPRSLSERFKKHLLNWSSSWFAYTQGTVDYLVSAGVPYEKITSVDNAVDTNGFQKLLASVTSEEIIEKRRKFGITEGDRVALYCGSLYAEKRIPYLLNAAKLIAQSDPCFRLLIVGGGVDAELVQCACNRSPYLIYAGPLFGRDKAVCFRMADFFLNPGLVGLGILDSFCAGLPFVTTSEALHSPEIDYLEDGVNGLMVSGDELVFAGAVIDLTRNSECIALMRQAARDTAARYTIENMVEKTVHGILKSLELKIEPKNTVSDNRLP